MYFFSYIQCYHHDSCHISHHLDFCHCILKVFPSLSLPTYSIFLTHQQNAPFKIPVKWDPPFSQSKSLLCKGVSDLPLSKLPPSTGDPVVHWKLLLHSWFRTSSPFLLKIFCTQVLTWLKSSAPSNFYSNMTFSMRHIQITGFNCHVHLPVLTALTSHLCFSTFPSQYPFTE